MKYDIVPLNGYMYARWKMNTSILSIKRRGNENLLKLNLSSKMDL